MTMVNDKCARWHPHLTVACMAQREGRYLMVRENHCGHSVLNQPAGHVEKGESLVGAVIRETLEETGWEFAPEYISGIYQFLAGDGETYLRFTFAGDLITERTGHSLDPAIAEVVWMDRLSLENSRDFLRSQVVLKCIADYEAGNRLPLGCVQQLKLSA